MLNERATSSPTLISLVSPLQENPNGTQNQPNSKLEPHGWWLSVKHTHFGSLFVTIIALDQSALMGVLCAATARRRISQLGALQFAKTNAWPVIQVLI